MGDDIWGMMASSMAAAPLSAESSTTSTKKMTGMDNTGFLKLLMTQMQSQDPLNPSDGQDFFNQLAQLTSLEQMWQMNDSLNSMLQQQQVLQGSSMIGRTVEGQTETGAAVSGVVSGVKVTDTTVWLTVGQAQLPLSNVTTVRSS